MHPARRTFTMPMRKRLWVLLGLWAIRLKKRIRGERGTAATREFLPSRILYFEFTRAGDIVCAGPFLALLKRVWPAAPITLVVYREVADVPRGLDEVDNIVVINKRSLFGAVRQLWHLRKADDALVLSHSINPLVALFFLMTSARAFAGYLWTRTFVRLPGRPLVLQPVAHPFGHLVDQRLEIARALQLPDSDAPPVHFRPRMEQIGPAVSQMLEYCARKREAGKAVVAMSPASRTPIKQWPLRYFDQLARLLLQRNPDLVLLIFGGEKEKTLPLALKEFAPGRVIDATTMTSFMEFAALIGGSSLVITNDSAALHLAAAQRVPAIGLFGPVSPDIVLHRFPGYSSVGLQGTDPCLCGYDVFRDRDCPYENRCLTSLAPERVAEAAWRLLPPSREHQKKSPASEQRVSNAGALV